MTTLEDFYEDDIWLKIVEFHSRKNHNQELLIDVKKNLDNYEDIAIVILGIFEDEKSLKWINSKPNVLGGKSPVECMKSPETIKRLKVALTRFKI